MHGCLTANGMNILYNLPSLLFATKQPPGTKWLIAVHLKVFSKSSLKVHHTYLLKKQLQHVLKVRDMPLMIPPHTHPQILVWFLYFWECGLPLKAIFRTLQPYWKVKIEPHSTSRSQNYPQILGNPLFPGCTKVNNCSTFPLMNHFLMVMLAKFIWRHIKREVERNVRACNLKNLKHFNEVASMLVLNLVIIILY